MADLINLGCDCCGCTLCGSCIASFSLLDCIPLTFAWPVVNPGDSCGPFGATSPNNSTETHTGCVHQFNQCDSSSTTTTYTYNDNCTGRPCPPNGTSSGYTNAITLDVTKTVETKVSISVEQASPLVIWRVVITKALVVQVVKTVVSTAITYTCSGGRLTTTSSEPTTTTTSVFLSTGAFNQATGPCSGNPAAKRCIQQYVLSETLDCDNVCDAKTLTRWSESTSGSVAADTYTPTCIPTSILDVCTKSCSPPTIDISMSCPCSTTIQVQLDCVS
jgi:hypothetical protein